MLNALFDHDYQPVFVSKRSAHLEIGKYFNGINPNPPMDFVRSAWPAHKSPALRPEATINESPLEAAKHCGVLTQLVVYGSNHNP